MFPLCHRAPKTDNKTHQWGTLEVLVESVMYVLFYKNHLLGHFRWSEDQIYMICRGISIFTWIEWVGGFFCLTVMRSNIEPKTPPGTGRKRHANVRDAVHMNCRLSQSHSRVSLIPWFCAAVQKWKIKPSRRKFDLWQTENKVCSSHTDRPFSGGGAGRPTSDWTQTCLSVCKRTPKLQSDPRVLIVFCMYDHCARLSLPELSSAAGMSHPHNHKVIYRQ